MSNSNKYQDVDNLLKSLFKESDDFSRFPLRELFEQRLDYLSITKNQACNILGLENKSIDSFLSGDTKKIDFVTILKFSDFLDISYQDLLDKYFNLVADNHDDDISQAKKRSFIVNNFDLPTLKKIGLINSISDFLDIEMQINRFFGYNSIFEYGKHKVTAAFSSAKRKTNQNNLDFWLEVVGETLDKTPNPNEYNREALINYFPKIRWRSLDVENGLVEVAKQLFKLGITIVFVPKFASDIHERGATTRFRGKPCIALTKYTGFYPSLWFCLIHELFHVLYDWETIKEGEYHVSGDEEAIKKNEDEANDFARKYFLSDEKYKIIISHINEPLYLKRFAESNHIHPSFIYLFYAWDQNDEKIYAKFNKYFPSFDKLLEAFQHSQYLEFKPLEEITKERNINLNYNSY